MRLRDVEEQIRDGDLLLLRGGGLLSRLIRVAGRSVYSHAAMAAWWRGKLMLLEMRGSGGRAVTLKSQVEAYPGRWDWFALRPRWEDKRSAAVDEMIELAGVPYGWWNLACSAAYHLPVVRLVMRPSVDDRSDGGRLLKPHCSQAVAASYRLAGADPVPMLADYVTEPADLARSVMFEWRGTLVP